MKIIFLTGAGISANAGLPTYRGPTGIYTNSEFQIEDFLTFDNYKLNTEEVEDYIGLLKNQFSSVEPSTWHEYIVELEKEHEILVVTQNVDGLHQKAGSSNVIELHGNISRRVIREGFDVPDVVFFGDQLNNRLFDAIEEFDNGDLDLCVIVGSSMPFPYLDEIAFSGKKTVLVDIDKNHPYIAAVDAYYSDIKELSLVSLFPDHMG